MNRLLKVAPLALVILSSGTVTSAQSNTVPNTAQKVPPPDPNQRICEDVTQTGSRLGTKRFCATRSEWEDKRRQDREAVEKAQTSPCVLSHNGSNGTQSC
jgi:hypothetical protein